MLLSKIDQKSDLDASKYYTITFQEFSKLTGVNMMRTGYRPHLQQTVENLENRTFWVPDGPDAIKSVSWVSKGSIVNFKEKDHQDALQSGYLAGHCAADQQLYFL